MKTAKRVLYLTRNGLLEPLGQSQILSYLKPLSKQHHFHIVSFEKAKDLENQAYYREIKDICQQHGISWTPLSYRKGQRQLSIIRGFLSLVRTAIKICRKDQIELIHARSYFPTFIALYIHWRQGIPFIFDMRALWPEELVVAGRLKAGSIAYKWIKWLEKKSLNKAAAIVSLTEAAVVHLAKLHQDIPIKEKTSVIPTCTDLKRFSQKGIEAVSSDDLIISCNGTLLSGWFKMNILQEVVDYLLSKHPELKFEILTRDAPQKIKANLDPQGKWNDRIQIESVAFKDMPAKLSQQHGSCFFFNADISKLGSSPTRMGELLGMGIPVLANDGVGDVGNIIREHQVGILIDGEAAASIQTACDEFIQIIQEPDIATRCRAVAEALFSLESGVSKYQHIYAGIGV